MKELNRDDESRALFVRSLKAVHAAFVSSYRLTEEEAKEGAETLADWFVRLSHRPGMSSRSAARVGDTFLLTVGACQLARDYQLWKLDGAPCGDEDLRKVLERDPREVAFDLLNKLIEESV